MSSAEKPFRVWKRCFASCIADFVSINVSSRSATQIQKQTTQFAVCSHTWSAPRSTNRIRIAVSLFPHIPQSSVSIQVPSSTGTIISKVERKLKSDINDACEYDVFIPLSSTQLISVGYSTC